jgi:diguanylate cyclase (GGDEF)-like protein
MPKIPVPPHELSRLSALARYNVLDTLPEPSYDDVAQLAAFIVGTPISLVSLIDAERQFSKSHIGMPGGEMPREQAFCSHAICTPNEVMVVEDASQDSRFADNPLVTGDTHVRFYAGAPLVTPDGHALGTLCVIDRNPRKINEEQKTALQTLARSLISVLELGLRTRELQGSNKVLERISLTDPLTGVSNRLAFKQRMQEETERSQRYSHPLSLLMLDIDHFKSYNDSYGHLAGDDLLKVFAEKLNDVVRGSDCVYRYGGEEFVVILPETDFNGAMIIGGRVREGLNAVEWPQRPVTCSIGISSMEGMMEADALVGQADRALYWVKEHGRNAVQHFELMRDGED